ncbi:TadE-like protein [Tindallia magadiensis]|uniref:TadE-like protein n=1 Tax=Tindallia magadiensis TaxID=69895 RepID=A0A1I3EJ60_9FIRM|nr:TadE family protein [Tindallia magadiensis]SFH98996.1 TadE-like protein [Tindallia magadiensis]
MIRKHLKSEKGQSLVEFALVLPILLILMSFTLDMAQAINSKMNVQHLAGEMVKAHTYFHRGGIENPGEHLSFDSRDDLIDHLVSESPLNEDGLTYKIIEGEVRDRTYVGKYWESSGNPGESRRFYGAHNTDTIQYITVEIEYTMDFGMFMTKAAFGDNIILSDKLTAAMYLGSDGDWPDPI